MARNETKIDITAEDKTAAAFSSVSSRLLGVEQSFGRLSGMIGGISAAAAVGFLASTVKNAADFADEMGKAAQKVGTTTEALSELKYAADLSDVSFEQLQTGLSKLAKTTEDFRNGSKTAVDAFAKLSIDPTKYKDTADIFGAVADKLAQMENGARKTAIAQELLGKSGAQLIPLLNSGADGLKQMADEANRFGVVVDEKAAKAAEKFNDNLTRISTLAEGAAIQLGGPLVDSLSQTTDAMIKSINEGNKLFALLQGFAGLGKLPWDFFFSSDVDVSSKSIAKQLEQDVQALEAGIVKLQKSGGGKLNEIMVGGTIDELNAKLKVARNQLEAVKKFGEQLEQKPPALPKAPGLEPSAVTGAGGGKKSSGKSEAEKYADDMAKLIKAFDDASQPAQTLSEKLQAQMDAYSALDPSVRGYLQNIIEQKKAQEESVIAADALAASIERNNELMAATQEYDNVAQALYNANAESYNAILREAEDLNIALIEDDKARALAQMDIEHARRLERIDLMEGEAEQIAAIRDAENERFEAQIKTAGKAASNTKSIGKELGLTFSSAFEDAVIGGKKFSDVLDSLAQDIEKMLLRRTVTEPLMGAVDSFLGGFDFGKIWNFNALGNVYSGAGISQYSGTVVSQPTMFASGGNVMGEAGPEGIFPLKRGKDGKLGVSAEGGGTNVTVNLIESPGNGGQVNQSQTGNNLTLDIMVEKIEGMIGRNISQGRGIAPTMERQYGLNRAAGSY